MVSKTLMIGVVAVIIVVIAGAGIYIAIQPAPTPQKLKMAVLLPGSITDAGWNSAMYVGATEVAQKMNSTVQVDIAEGLGEVGVEPTMRDYCSRGYTILICWTITYQDPALKVAADYPNVWFIVSSAWNKTSNVINFGGPMWEGAFLAGMVAGAVTNSNVIGAVAGFNYPTTAAVPLAFFDGAKRVNPNVQTLPIIFAGVWDDVGKGREAGSALIAAGADVLFSRGDGLTLGVIQAAAIASNPGTAKTVYMVGDMTDQNALAPKTIITSNMVLTEPALENIVNEVMNGTMKANSDAGKRDLNWGIKYGCSGIASFHGLDYKVPQYVKDMINRAISAFKAGTFVIHLYSNGTPWYEGNF